MAQIKISEMPTASSVNLTDYVPIVQNGINKKTSVENFVGNEAERVEAEKKRVEAEEARAAAERSRVQFEEIRKRDENTRTQNEENRTSAEESRVQAEESRVSSEEARKQAEQNRVKGENTRNSQEETRQEQEETRIKNEEERIARMEQEYYNGLYAKGETYSGIASNKGIKLHKVVGKTEQNTTNGYQLFDSSKLATRSQGGATVTNNGDGSFTISGSGNLKELYSNAYVYSNEQFKNFIKKGQLKLNDGSSNPKVSITFYDDSVSPSKVYVDLEHDRSSGTITDEILNNSNIKMRIRFYGLQNSAIETATIKPMLYQDGDGTWEQFTGGKPAPNPDYAMPIENVEISNITSHGRQLFDSSKVTTKSQGGATVTNNNDGSFTISGNGTVSELFVVNYDITGDIAKSFFKAGRVKTALSNVRPYFYFSFRHSGGIYGDVDSKSYTNFDLTDEMINSDGFYVRCGFQLPQGNEIVNGTIKPMVYQDGDGTWEEFHGDTVETSLTLAQDDIYQNGTITRARKQVVFDGSSDENWVKSSLLNGRMIFTIPDAKRTQKPVCNRFKAYETNQKEINRCVLDSNANFFVNSEFETVEKWKTWLQSHSLEVEYELATPTTEEYQVPTIPSYYPYTQISTDNDLTTDIEWELLGNSDNSLEIESLEKRIAALEKQLIGG